MPSPILRSALLAACAAVASPANAAWYQAKSKHFIIYENDSPKRLEEFANQLERFDQAVRFTLKMEDPPVGDGNRLAIYVMPNTNAVRQLSGDKSGFLDGFYSGRASGSLAYIGKPSGDSGLDTATVLYHEYTHHLMFQQLDRPYPEWYIEGFAEFFSSPSFERDGSVLLGRAAQHRAYGLLYTKQLPVERLLTGSYGDVNKLTDEERESLYGEGWLLVHYLFTDAGHQKQLISYISQLSSGVPQAEAARTAFGDFKQLGKDLEAYKTKRLLAFRIPDSKLHVEPIAITPLSDGAAQVILDRGRLKYHADKAAAETYLPNIQSAAALTPDDPIVEDTLTEAQLYEGNYDAAEAAADRAFKADPKDTESLVLKGRAMAEAADLDDGDDRDDRFEAARSVLVAANKLDSEDPEPLLEFYRTFLTEGIRPTDNAIAALHYASDLAPQDSGVRLNSAVAYINEGKLAEAKATLTTVAYSPHGAGASEAAKRMIEAIDSGAKGREVIEAGSKAGSQSQ